MSSGRVKTRRPRERFAFDDPKGQFENGFLSGRLSPTNADARRFRDVIHVRLTGRNGETRRRILFRFSCHCLTRWLATDTRTRNNDPPLA
jgi:hypothetical protein